MRRLRRFRAALFDQAVKARNSGVRWSQELQMEIIMISLEMLRRLLPRIGPYVVVEIVLPGGTLLALLLYLLRRRRRVNGVQPHGAPISSSVRHLQVRCR